MKYFLEFCMGLIMILMITAFMRFGLPEKKTVETLENSTEDQGFCVVVDPGHGGVDPGKIGVNNLLEKDVNLSIARKLRFYLENAGVRVVMTREEDIGLYQESDINKKLADLKARCACIEETAPALVLSIHQNSFSSEDVSGGQAFYYQDSAEGQELAEMVQESFSYVLGDKNTRKAKADGSYYMLLHTACPTVIAECGFLSNWEEAELLGSDEYQDRMAWALHMAVLRFLNR